MSAFVGVDIHLFWKFWLFVEMCMCSKCKFLILAYKDSKPKNDILCYYVVDLNFILIVMQSFVIMFGFIMLFVSICHFCHCIWSLGLTLKNKVTFLFPL